jgi:hypothetical protein
MLYFVNGINVKQKEFNKMVLKDLLLDQCFLDSFIVKFKEVNEKLKDLAMVYLKHILIDYLKDNEEEVIGSNSYKIK